MSVPAATDSHSLESLQEMFLAVLLPRVEVHAQVYFRHVACPQRRDDCIAETIAVSWKWFLRLVERGKDVRTFPCALAQRAAQHVRSGRKLCGQESSKDALSPTAQTRRGFVVSKFPDWETLSDNPFMNALIDNTRSPVDEQVAFRFDFPVWLGSLGDRKRSIAQDMMLGHRTRDLADNHGMSPGRVSQLRKEFSTDWLRFIGELL